MTNHYRRAFMVLTTAVLLLAAGLALTGPEAEDVAVVVNPQNPVDAITSTELRKIFSDEKRSWTSSLPVFLVVRAPQAREREVLLTRVLKMTESEYKQHWVKKVYSGEV